MFSFRPLKYMQEFFDTDSEIIGFNTLDEFFDRYRFILNNPKIADQIAANGKKRTLKDHTQVIDVIDFWNY